MARGLTTTIKNILDDKTIKYVDLLEIHLPGSLGGPFKLTNGPGDITLPTGSPTISGTDVIYSANGLWLNWSLPAETGQVRIQNVSIALSTADASYTYADLFLNNPYLNTRTVIYRQFLDADNNSLVGDPVMMWDGEIVSFNLSETNSEAGITLTSSSVFYAFDTVNCRRTNDASQQQYFPGDKGFQHATQAIEDIAWGKKV